MQVIYKGPIDVQYGQASIECHNVPFTDLSNTFVGQGNGICGAAVPDRLEFVTGLHTGIVDFEVQLHDSAPDLDHSWDEIVEVNFEAISDEHHLMGLMAEDAHLLSIPAGHSRVRYLARQMQEGHEQDTTDDDLVVIDSYCVQLWPGHAEPPLVVK